MSGGGASAGMSLSRRAPSRPMTSASSASPPAGCPSAPRNSSSGLPWLSLWIARGRDRLLWTEVRPASLVLAPRSRTDPLVQPCHWGFGGSPSGTPSTARAAVVVSLCSAAESTLGTPADPLVPVRVPPAAKLLDVDRWMHHRFPRPLGGFSSPQRSHVLPNQGPCGCRPNAMYGRFGQSSAFVPVGQLVCTAVGLGGLDKELDARPWSRAAAARFRLAIDL